MSDAPVPVSLDHVGSRYKHLTDLQDSWALGVEIKKSSLNRFSNTTDQLTLTKLEAGLELLKAYIDALSKKTAHMYKISREVDSIAKIKTKDNTKVEGKTTVGGDVSSSKDVPADDAPPSSYAR